MANKQLTTAKGDFTPIVEVNSFQGVFWGVAKAAPTESIEYTAEMRYYYAAGKFYFGSLLNSGILKACKNSAIVPAVAGAMYYNAAEGALYQGGSSGALAKQSSVVPQALTDLATKIGQGYSVVLTKE